MPLDQSLVGRSYPPAPPYHVCREKIREFASAIGATDPAYRDPDAARALGHPDVIAPPTFPIVILMDGSGQVYDDPDLGLDYDRVVHGEQRFRYTRPVRAGDRLTYVRTVEDVSNRRLFGSVLLRADVATEGGEPVVTVWTRLVARLEP